MSPAAWLSGHKVFRMYKIERFRREEARPSGIIASTVRLYPTPEAPNPKLILEQ
jgi:hypothetical protein